jgi:hypothetical protein
MCYYTLAKDVRKQMERTVNVQFPYGARRQFFDNVRAYFPRNFWGNSALGYVLWDPSKPQKEYLLFEKTRKHPPCTETDIVARITELEVSSIHRIVHKSANTTFSMIFEEATASDGAKRSWSHLWSSFVDKTSLTASLVFFTP